MYERITFLSIWNPLNWDNSSQFRQFLSIWTHNVALDCVIPVYHNPHTVVISFGFSDGLECFRWLIASSSLISPHYQDYEQNTNTWLSYTCRHKSDPSHRPNSKSEYTPSRQLHSSQLQPRIRTHHTTKSFIDLRWQPIKCRVIHWINLASGLFGKHNTIIFNTWTSPFSSLSTSLVLMVKKFLPTSWTLLHILPGESDARLKNSNLFTCYASNHLCSYPRSKPMSNDPGLDLDHHVP